MALSTMRMAMRPNLLRQTLIISRFTIPMSGTAFDEQKTYWDKKQLPTAKDEMNSFWQKNIRLQRPSSPWTIYKPQWTWCLSLAHRISGIAMGCVLYILSIGLFAAPGDFATYVEFIQALELSPAILWPMKTLVAWPLCYHYSNGIRHLAWDAGKGFSLPVIYKYGKMNFVATWILAGTLAALAYM